MSPPQGRAAQTLSDWAEGSSVAERSIGGISMVSCVILRKLFTYPHTFLRLAKRFFLFDLFGSSDDKVRPRSDVTLTCIFCWFHHKWMHGDKLRLHMWTLVIGFHFRALYETRPVRCIYCKARSLLLFTSRGQQWFSSCLDAWKLKEVEEEMMFPTSSVSLNQQIAVEVTISWFPPSPAAVWCLFGPTATPTCLLMQSLYWRQSLTDATGCRWEITFLNTNSHSRGYAITLRRL